ncbi:MAG: cadherin repeat domain-containing protein [bacterium]|nr:cadherin repeat domain-containing protein [bacterium]
MKRLEYVKLSIIAILMCFLVICGTSACSGGETDPDSSSGSHNTITYDIAKKTEEAPKKKQENEEENTGATKISLGDVVLTPENITIESTITAKATILPDDADAVELNYIFSVASQVVKEGDENTLELKEYKKNTFVYVDVEVMDGKSKGLRKRSDMMRINNTSPEITGIDIPEIRGEGTHRITVNAEDIDGDTLIYSMEGDNLPTELSIDATMGVIEYQLTGKPPEKIVFTVFVKDGDEGEASQEVTLNFNPQQTAEEE